jgi:hypothetical protein
MLSLPDVTLIAYTSRNAEGHQQALDYSSRDIKFGAVKLVTFDPFPSIDEWNYRIIYDLRNHVDTEFALLVHDDGFVVNPQQWNPEWLNYDYIGAPWPYIEAFKDANGTPIRVGNSVGLRSRKILDLPSTLGLEWKSYMFNNTNEDAFLAIHNRRVLDMEGCKFAPFEVAVNFSREIPLPENRGINPFMFHTYEGENASYPKFRP